METKHCFESDLHDKQQRIQQLESHVDHMQKEIDTKDRRSEELQLVIDWKDDQYKKIQLSLQAKIHDLEEERKVKEVYFDKELQSFKHKIECLQNQSVPLYQREIDKETTEFKSNEMPISNEPTKEKPERMIDKLPDTGCNKENESIHQTAESIKIDQESREPDTERETEKIEKIDMPPNSECDQVKENKKSKMIIFGETGNHPRAELNTTISIKQDHRKLPGQKKKKVTKKRQSQKKNLQMWKSQVEQESKRDTTGSPSSKKKCLLQEEEKMNAFSTVNLPQEEDLSDADSIGGIGWGFRDDDIVYDELLHVTADRKRKSTVMESMEELQPIRKSRRLEEKRLAKTKID